MSCRKCGSSWQTKTGKDCSSCPYCCKQQRCRARKEGRWAEPGQPHRVCKTCSKPFTSTHNKQKCCSAECSKVLRKAWLKSWKKEYSRSYKIGQKRGTQARPNESACLCHMCGKSFKRHGRKKYCSRACFAAARKCGVQSWDRTGQMDAVYHRGGRWKNAPSKKYIASVKKIDAWLIKASRLWQAMIEENAKPSRECETCGSVLRDAKSAGVGRFCSRACAKAWRGVRLCKCGAEVPNASAHSRPSCDECKRKSRRLHKRMYGCYRRRCKTYGGHYNPTVKPRDVFERDGWRCHVCGKKTSKVFRLSDPRSATVDHHPIPLSKGGDHDWHNVRCCCFECNSLKGAKWDGQRRLRLLT